MRVVRGGDVRSGALLVTIISDTTPPELPVNGKDVDGMTENQTFAPGSILYVVDKDASPKYYMANEKGIFVGQPLVDADEVRNIIDDFERRMFWTFHGSLNGYVLVYQGTTLEYLGTDASYAGRTVYVTVINNAGEETTSVEVGENGAIWPWGGKSLTAGYNFIFCETDSAQKGENQLIGPTAIPLTAYHQRLNWKFADTRFLDFLTAHGIERVFTEVTPRPTTLDSNVAYYVKRHTDDSYIWEDIGAIDGDYYIRIYSLEHAEEGEAVYVCSYLRSEQP